MTSGPYPDQYDGLPAKRKRGLWLSIGGGIVGGLLVVLITGFVAPGFFLDKEPDNARPGTAGNLPAAEVGGRKYTDRKLLDTTPHETVRRSTTMSR